MVVDLPKLRKIIVPANILKRGFAFLIDIFIVDFFILSAFREILTKLVPNTMNIGTILQNNSVSSGIMYIFISVALLSLGYFMLCEYLVGQTPGKIILGLHIESKGELTLIKSLLRNLFLVPVFPLFLLIFIDPIFIVFSKKDQRLSEYLSNTRTVEIKYG